MGRMIEPPRGECFQVSMQLEAETEEGHTALTIATRTGVFPIWKEIASRLPALEVGRAQGRRAWTRA